MSKLNGHDKPPNVASLDDARKRAAEKAKAEKRAARPGGPATPRDWLIGGLFIAMALGLVVWFVMRLTGGSG